jgi:protein involved in polysaccharide export with SLBB domain
MSGYGYYSDRIKVEPVAPEMREANAISSNYKGYQQADKLPYLPNSRSSYACAPGEAGGQMPLRVETKGARGMPIANVNAQMIGGAKENAEFQPIKELIFGGNKESFEGRRKYRFGISDQLTLYVDNHKELSGKLQVLTDGMVELPLIKERVLALNRTKDELIVAIKKVLENYVKYDPVVKIGIDFASGQYYYVIGEVPNAGRFSMGLRQIKLSEAVFRACSSSVSYDTEDVSLADRMRNEMDTFMRTNYTTKVTGDLRKVYLITPHRSQPTRKVINVKRILHEGRSGEDVLIKPGQIIFIPSATDTRIERFVTKVIAPFSSISSLDAEGDYWYNRIKKRTNQEDSWEIRTNR